MVVPCRCGQRKLDQTQNVINLASAAAEMSAVLPQQQQQWSRGPWNDLHRAARDGSIQRAIALISRGSLDINQSTPEGFTALMICARKGHSSIVRILLNKGADMSIMGENGFTALHAAAQFGHLEVIVALVKAGADLRATYTVGSTALHLASHEGHLEVVAALVEAGADPQATTTVGATPLHLAATDGHSEVVGALIDAGVSCNTRFPRSGASPLMLAASGGHLEAVKVLLRSGANPLLAVTLGQSTQLPLDAAALHGHKEVVRELVQQVGIEGCGGASGGVDALRRATQEQREDIMAILAEAGVMDTGEALIDAVRTGHAAAVKLLIQQWERNDRHVGRYVNTDDYFGIAPLVHAIRDFGRCSPRVVRLLVDAGADTTSVLRTIHTPGDHVVSHATPLDLTTHMLQAKKMADRKEATEEQLHGLDGIRRLLLCVEAIHAISWLWPNDNPMISRAAEGPRTGKNTSTPLRMMLPALRRRARRRVVLLGACAGIPRDQEESIPNPVL